MVYFIKLYKEKKPIVVHCDRVLEWGEYFIFKRKNGPYVEEVAKIRKDEIIGYYMKGR